jgi:uncharacterized membrane protein
LRGARRTDKITARTRPKEEERGHLTAASMPLVVAARPRLAVLDLIRGIAVVAMVVYHLSWDFLDYGLINVDVVNDPLWRGFAHAIAGTFLALVGFNLALANRNGIRPLPYLRRLGIIAGAASLVSVGTYLFDKDTFVFFGILHLIVVASVLALPFLRAPVAVTLAVAVFFLAVPAVLQNQWASGSDAAAIATSISEAFDVKPLLPLGLSAHLVSTVDYVPVFPWFGVVLLGLAAGRVILERGAATRLGQWRFPAMAWQPILLAGRWSLPIYLVHQPLLIGIISLLMPFLAESDEALAGRFLGQCKTSCQSSGESPATCRSTCECAASGAEGARLLAHLMAGTMSYAEDRSWQSIIEQCLPKQQPPVTRG